MAHTTFSRGINLIAAASVLLLTACTGYGTGGSNSSGIGSGSSGRPSVSSAASRSSSSGPRFSNFLSSSSSLSTAPFFSIKRSSSSSSVAVIAPVVPPSSVATVPTEAVKLFVEADRGEAHPGETIYYTITVKNMTMVPLHDFPVVFSFAPTQMSVQEADGAVYADNVQWTVDALQPGQKRGLRVRMQIATDVQGGEIIRGNALVTIAGAVTDYPSPDIAIINEMPATGGGGFTEPMEDTRRFLRPL